MSRYHPPVRFRGTDPNDKIEKSGQLLSIANFTGKEDTARYVVLWDGNLFATTYNVIRTDAEDPWQIVVEMFQMHEVWGYNE